MLGTSPLRALTQRTKDEISLNTPSHSHSKTERDHSQLLVTVFDLPELAKCGGRM